MPAVLPASRRLGQISALFILGAGLSACAMLGEDTTAGPPFTQALSRNYTALAEQAAQVPGASAQDEGYLDSLFGIFDTPTANPAAQLFTVKADRAGQGEEIAPEPAGGDFQAQSMRARLIRALESGREAMPDVAARAGGQSRITVVGHTDTSGDAAYNQKLSVHRANVVMEAMVDMGARRAAIQVSGVGESDLAVATEDGVKEARNRRAVIDLLP